MRRPHPLMSILAGCRHARHRSQRDVAERIGTSQSILSAWESGRKWPTLARFDALAADLGYELTLTPRGGPMAKVKREKTSSLEITSIPSYSGPMNVGILRDFVRALDAEGVADRIPLTCIHDSGSRLSGLRVREVITESEPANE